MARWQPGAAERLQQAALELFATRGFEHTTAAEIARAVGLTERTFFRHFSDKRDVLFRGQEVFVRAFADAVESAPANASPLESVALALRDMARFFTDDRRSRSRMRKAVIDHNPALLERERHKYADIAEAVAGALRARGVDEVAAVLAAESGVSMLGVTYSQWVREHEQRPFADIAALALRELVNLVATTDGELSRGEQPIQRNRPKSSKKSSAATGNSTGE